MYDDPNVIYERRQRAAERAAAPKSVLEESRKLVEDIERRRDNDINRAHLTDGQRLRLEPDFQPERPNFYGGNARQSPTPDRPAHDPWAAGYSAHLATPAELSHLTPEQAAQLGYGTDRGTA